MRPGVGGPDEVEHCSAGECEPDEVLAGQQLQYPAPGRTAGQS